MTYFISDFCIIIDPVIQTLKDHYPLLSVMYSPKDFTQLATGGRAGGAKVIDFRADPNKYVNRPNWDEYFNHYGTN